MSATPPGETIFALSSGAVPAAIAIVRVSGPAAGDVLDQLAGGRPEARYARHAALRDAAGTLIDRGLVLWFPGPGSATGEDLAEFHLHGGRAVVAATLAALAALPGLRIAEPGEFTRRAFLNGRLDLTAAEGLADLLAAETESQHARALQIAEGGLGRVIERWRTTILDLSARIEAAIEYGDTDDDVGAPDPLLRAPLMALVDEATALLATPPAERLRDGIRIVVAGPPNAGKSSLINALVGRDVAIATPIAGTTRDVIEAPVTLGRHAVLLIDTAGLREAEEEIERLGVARAWDALARADLVLWCGEAADCPVDDGMLLFTRADERKGIPMAGPVLPVSIRDHSSIEMLRRNIEMRCDALTGRPDGLSLNARQRSLTRIVADEAAAAVSLDDLLLVAEHFRACRSTLDAIVGRSGVEEMLDSLFGQFCLGK